MRGKRARGEHPRLHQGLQLGDGHVRNGDRFRVLGPGPDNGLIVEHLAGRGRAALPASYLVGGPELVVQRDHRIGRAHHMCRS